MNSTFHPRAPLYSAASAAFAALLAALWFVARSLSVANGMSAALIPAFVSFALLLAPLWFFAFGLADDLRAALRSNVVRELAPAILAMPYLLYSIPLHEFQLKFVIALVLLPVGLTVLLSRSPRINRLLWQDIVALLILAFTLELGLLSGAWPQRGLGSLPKIYLADVALYLYLVVREVDGMGYSFLPQPSALLIGAREWLFYLPLALGLGFWTHFIRFIPRTHSIGHISASVVEIFLLTAVPEEIYFRGILQNLLEPITGRGRSLAITAALFGLSHFHKGAVFNWRYVILAAIAGVFYGRAWREKRQLLASAVTHTAVDTIWSLWFR